jgi:hypothetical protein
MVAPVRAGAGFVTDEPRALFNRAGVFVASSVVPYYDLSPDDSGHHGSAPSTASGGGK